MIGGDVRPYGNVRVSVVEQETYDPSLKAIKISDVPSNMQQFIDYVARTDGNPVYMGFADKDLGISASGWLLQKFTYNASGQMLTRQISYDSWDDRGLTTFS